MSENDLVEFIQLISDAAGEMEYIHRQRRPSPDFDRIFAAYKKFKGLLTRTAEINLSDRSNKHKKMFIVAGDDEQFIIRVGNDYDQKLFLLWNSSQVVDFLTKANDFREGNRSSVAVAPVTLTSDPNARKNSFFLETITVKLYLTGSEFYDLRTSLERCLIPKYRSIKIIK